MSAIRFIHQNDYVFRDLKLENCLIDWNPKTSDTNLILCDFGFCEYLAPGNSFEKVVGTEGYLAPEQLKKQPYGKPVDMWTYGIVLYALVAGGHPFGIDDWESRANIGEFDKDLLSFSNPPPEAVDLITKCLDPDPSTRITAEEAFKHDFFYGDMMAMKQESMESLDKSFAAAGAFLSID